MKDSKESKNLSYIQSMKCGVASLLSSCISISLVHPLEVIKVRFQSMNAVIKVTMDRPMNKISCPSTEASSMPLNKSLKMKGLKDCTKVYR